MNSLQSPIGRAIAVFCLLAMVMEVPRAAVWIGAGLLLATALHRLRRGAIGFRRRVASIDQPFRLDQARQPGN